MKVEYKGQFMSDGTLPGCRKCDGVIPGVTSVIRLSSDRFCVFWVPHMMGAWDMNTAINYQIRADSPVGSILSEGVAMEEEPDWRPFGIQLYRCPGLSFAYGVPKGAKMEDGSVFLNENLFVLHTYLNPQLHWNGEVMIPVGAALGKYPNWPKHIEPNDLSRNLPRVFNRHFRLNEDDDDIEFLTPWEMVYQEGFEAGFDGPFCAFGDSCRNMASGFTPPRPSDSDCTGWYDIPTFGVRNPDGTSLFEKSGLAAIRYTWKEDEGRYRWTETGPLVRVDDRKLSESGLTQIDGDWLITMRSRPAKPAPRAIQIKETGTIWYRTRYPLRGFGEPFYSAVEGDVPRMPFRFANGRLGIVFPEERWVPLEPGEPIPMIAYDPERGKYARDPLVMFDVESETLKYSSRRILADVEGDGIAIRTPASDHVTITPAVDRKQWLLFRIKDRDAATTGNPTGRLAASGIYYIELTYDESPASEWRF